MPRTQIDELFRFKDRFMRSTNLERDFDDEDALVGYVVTPHIRTSLGRLISGLAPGSGQRAWRITGDYGTGKSSFAVAFARLLAGHKGVPSSVRRAVGTSVTNKSELGLLPVLVTGTRKAVAAPLLQSLHRALLATHTRGKRPRILGQIAQAAQRAGDGAVLDERIVELVLEANDYIARSGKGTGVLIVLDELGKFLEYAALHPDRQDIGFLQTLAETAARSGEKPLLVVGMLHQGFNAYAGQLSEVTQREWEKVAGRYEELHFDQPLEETAILIANALDIRTEKLSRRVISECEREMTEALGLGWFGARANHGSLIERAAKFYPLHPTVLPALVGLFRRFGQNERSLFGFLLSNEPFSLRAFAGQPVGPGRFYRLHNLYDYARASFGHRLSVESYRSHWNQVEAIVESHPEEDAVQLQVLKAVAILNLLDDNALLASEAALELSLHTPPASTRGDVRKAIERLQKGKRVLYYRGVAGGYCLWPHTSVNLEKAYREAGEALGRPERTSELIKDELDTRPLVARRHYIETGNLRHYEVRYVPVSELGTAVQPCHESHDGLILVPLCETEEEHQIALGFAKGKRLLDLPGLLVAVPKPLSALSGLVQECRKWDWVARNVPELNHDSSAAEEVSRQTATSRQILQKRLQSFIGLRLFGRESHLDWFCQGEPLQIENGRELLAKLSDICDEVYTEAPHIHNELLNRRSLSSAASAARMRLLERMCDQGGEPLLGMDPRKKPPEMSMYLSVLRESGLHGDVGASPGFTEPHPRKDSCRMRPSLRKIDALLKDKADAKVRVSEIFEQLMLPPYGVRCGLCPVLLTAYMMIHENDVALYEDGGFVRETGGHELRRLVKAPHTFELQLCRIGGVRKQVFLRLVKVLGLSSADELEGNILEVVRPLCVFVAELPEYAQRTRRLSEAARGVREALVRATEPVKLLYTELPEACGLKPFGSRRGGGPEGAEPFVSALRDVVLELKAAYPDLLTSMRENIRTAFDIPGTFDQVRDTLSDSAEGMLVSVTEPGLRAFLFRLFDSHLAESQWLESLGSFVCTKPPSKWTDRDADVFDEKLLHIAQKFRRVESLVFGGSSDSRYAESVRISVTRPDGEEVESVVRLAAQEEAVAKEIEATVMSLLSRAKRPGLAGVSRAVWRALSPAEEGERT